MTRLVLICALCFLASCTRAAEQQRALPKLVVSMVVPCGTPTAGEQIDFGGQNQKFCLDRSPLMTEADVVSAHLEKSFPGKSVVRLSLRDQASKRLREITSKHIQDKVGIILKGKPLFVAIIQEPVPDIYLGPFPDAQAMEVAREFNVGNRE